MSEWVYSKFKVKFFFILNKAKIKELVAINIPDPVEEEEINFIYCKNFEAATNCKNSLINLIHKKIQEILDDWRRIPNRNRKQLSNKFKKRIVNKDSRYKLVEIVENNSGIAEGERYDEYLEKLIEILPDAGNVEHYNALWNEYNYRHDLIWRYMFRVIAATAAIVIIPYTKNYLKEKFYFPDYSYLVLLIIPFLVVIISILVVINEVGLLDLIKTKYREYQKKIFDIDHEKRVGLKKIMKFNNLLFIFFTVCFFITCLHIYFGKFIYKYTYKEPDIKEIFYRICNGSNEQLCREISIIALKKKPQANYEVLDLVDLICKDSNLSACRELEKFRKIPQNSNSLVKIRKSVSIRHTGKNETKIEEQTNITEEEDPKH